MEDSYWGEVLGTDMGFKLARNRLYCVRSLRFGGCLFWQHNLACSDCSRCKEVIKLLLWLIVFQIPPNIYHLFAGMPFSDTQWIWIWLFWLSSHPSTPKNLQCPCRCELKEQTVLAVMTCWQLKHKRSKGEEVLYLAYYRYSTNIYWQ